MTRWINNSWISYLLRGSVASQWRHRQPPCSTNHPNKMPICWTWSTHQLGGRGREGRRERERERERERIFGGMRVRLWHTKPKGENEGEDTHGGEAVMTAGQAKSIWQSQSVNYLLPPHMPACVCACVCPSNRAMLILATRCRDRYQPVKVLSC